MSREMTVFYSLKNSFLKKFKPKKFLLEEWIFLLNTLHYPVINSLKKISEEPFNLIKNSGAAFFHQFCPCLPFYFIEKNIKEYLKNGL